MFSDPMKRISFFFLFVAISLWSSTPSKVHAQTDFTAEYTIIVEHPETHIMHVDAVFTHPPSSLRLRIWLTGTLTFQISMSPDEVITYPFQVANIEVTDEKGHAVPFTWHPHPGNASYLLISAAGRQQIHLSYDVAVLRPADVRIGWSHARAEVYLGPDYGVFVPDDTLFLSPLLDNVTLHFRLPEGWRAVAEGEEISSHDYRISTRTSFTEPCICGTLSFIAMGPFHVFRKTVEGEEFIVAIQEGQPIPVAQMLDLSARSFDYYWHTFGPYRCSQRFLTIFVNDRSSGGCFHGFLFSPRSGNSTLHNYGGHGKGCYPLWQMMIPDEMIYLWMDQLGVYENPHQSALWLIQSMGVTFYRLAVKLGYATEAQYYERQISDWEVYKDDLRSAGLTNAQVVLATTDSPMIVGKSGLVTAMLREEIVEATHGEKDFDDLLKMVVVPNPKGFSNQDILRALRELTGKDFSDFFQKYIYGTADLDMSWLQKKYQEALAHGDAQPHPDPRPGLLGWQIDWNASRVIEDGNTQEWPALFPSSITIEGVSVYFADDANYLYLRVDDYQDLQGQKLVLTLFPAQGSPLGVFIDPKAPYYVALHGAHQTYLPVAFPQKGSLEVVIPHSLLGHCTGRWQIWGTLSTAASATDFAAVMVKPTATPTLTALPSPTVTPLPTLPVLTATSKSVAILTPTQVSQRSSNDSDQMVFFGVLVAAFVVGGLLGRWAKVRG